MMPTATPAETTPQQQRRLAKRQERKLEAVARRKAAAKEKAERDEQKAEWLAPRVQRVAIYGRDGRQLRGARVEQSGIGMLRSNPIKRWAARSRGKDNPAITDAHVKAADSLRTAWEEATGSPAPCTNYGERQPARGMPGALSASAIEAANNYVRARDEVLRVEEQLGTLWPVIHAVVILGIDPTSWGSVQGMSGERGIGYAMAALDALVALYEPPKERRPGRILFAEFESNFQN